MLGRESLAEFWLAWTGVQTSYKHFAKLCVCVSVHPFIRKIESLSDREALGILCAKSYSKMAILFWLLVTYRNKKKMDREVSVV